MSHTGFREEGGCGPYCCEVRRDDQGRIVARREHVDGMCREYEYIYDEAGRLYNVRRDGVGVEQYLYDRQGRRRSDFNSLREGLSRGFFYSDDDRLLRAGDMHYHHDGLGFRFARSAENWTWRYWYSPDYRLVRVNLPEGGCVEYSHDEDGQRILKTVNGRQDERYQWHDKTTLAAYHDGMSWSEFEYGRERMPHAMYRGGKRYSLHYDQVGTLRVVADAMGNVIKRMEYDSFGNILEDTNPSFKMPFGFAGGLHDRDTGLVRFGWRDYDPDTGRWTAKDPIGYAGGDSDLYGYCLDDPINGYDPMGLFNFGEFASSLFGNGNSSSVTPYDIGSPGGAISEWKDAVNPAGQWTPQGVEVAANGRNREKIIDGMIPPLLHKKGHPSRDWADGVLKEELGHLGKNMLGLGAPPIVGGFQEMGKEGSFKDYCKGYLKGTFPYVDPDSVNTVLYELTDGRVERMKPHMRRYSYKPKGQ
ncbi:RHS repeat domain-containing protein [Salidesulfovibrio onnuriiensis]|uniref:RHS repeat domain-containing protein n=1 Tax=Salidesulfovibrio onnuriiensis TaxID=2583823 RepID=UPI00164FD089|nr:RHS repeat-associated core domain-containing protein [Salidesulfovibrio onnuriiensis]